MGARRSRQTRNHTGPGPSAWTSSMCVGSRATSSRRAVAILGGMGARLIAHSGSSHHRHMGSLLLSLASGNAILRSWGRGRRT
jgi:hypothetical protein